MTATQENERITVTVGGQKHEGTIKVATQSGETLMVRLDRPYFGRDHLVLSHIGGQWTTDDRCPAIIERHS